MLELLLAMSFRGSQKGTKKFVSSNRINLIEYRPLFKEEAWPRWVILPWHAGYVLYEL